MGELRPLAGRGAANIVVVLRTIAKCLFPSQLLSRNNMGCRKCCPFCPRIEFWRGTTPACIESLRIEGTPYYRTLTGGGGCEVTYNCWKVASGMIADVGAGAKAMDSYWKVISRKGSRLTLERDHERIEIRCPSKPYAKELFLMMRPGQVIDDDTVGVLERGK